MYYILTLLQSERPKLNGVSSILVLFYIYEFQMWSDEMQNAVAAFCKTSEVIWKKFQRNPTKYNRRSCKEKFNKYKK